MGGVTPSLAHIHVYPVKSLGGFELESVAVEPWGARDDRRWVVLDPDGVALTAREVPPMLQLHATPLDGGGVLISARDGSELRVRTPDGGPQTPTTITRLDAVRRAGPDADAWLSRQLGRPVRLGWLDDPRRRTVSERHGGGPGDHLTLADAGPILLTSQTSLRRLNQWIAEGAADRGENPPAEISMRRFRPNLVVENVPEAFVEDAWLRVRVGAVELRLGEHCDRCFLTTFEPDTLERGKEPLRTLARKRRWDHKTWFGVRLIPVEPGTIHVGDAIDVLERRAG